MNYQSRQVARSVFRAYDIRGIIGKDLDEDAFYSIGLAIAYRLREVNRSQIFLARDGRLTSLSLANALKQGLLEGALDVVDLAAMPTPVLYYATQTQPIDSGVIVTGSHNPTEYNGIKIVIAGKTLSQEDIDILYQYVKEAKRTNNISKGLESSLDIIPAYIQQIVQDIRLKRPLKVVVDCGNGISGPLVPKVLRDLACEVIPLYCEVDGRFPNHHPDPTVESNLADLRASIALHQADIGLAFDGDGDRLGILCNKGEMIKPDRLMMLYSKEILSRLAGARIVFDVKCSSHLEKFIESAGGVATMCPTGHSIVKSVMRQENAVLAGEMSGHLFFKDRWFGFDDALYSACRLLEIISASALTVSEQFASIPNSVNTPELKIDIDEDKKFHFMQRFSDEACFKDARLIRIDGIRAEFAKGWGLLRASNTTACLVARFEAEDLENLVQIQALFKKQIQQLDAQLIVPF